MDDILYEIFRYLNLQDAHSFALTSSQHYNVFNYNSLWKFYLLTYDDHTRMIWQYLHLDGKRLESFSNQEFRDVWAGNYKETYKRYHRILKLKNKMNLFGSITYIFNDKYLSLQDHNLFSIPREIGVLTNLNKLFLHINQLTAVPKEICELTNLTELALDSNQIQTIPKEIGNLTNLESLWLNNNKLISIPKELGNLMKLEKLCLHHNNLITLPDELVNLINLKWIHLAWNLLTYIPKGLYDIPDIRIII